LLWQIHLARTNGLCNLTVTQLQVAYGILVDRRNFGRCFDQRVCYRSIAITSGQAGLIVGRHRCGRSPLPGNLWDRRATSRFGCGNAFWQGEVIPDGGVCCSISTSVKASAGIADIYPFPRSGRNRSGQFATANLNGHPLGPRARCVSGHFCVAERLSAQGPMRRQLKNWL
jgi:hypothetical protein